MKKEYSVLLGLLVLGAVLHFGGFLQAVTNINGEQIEVIGDNLIVTGIEYGGPEPCARTGSLEISKTDWDKIRDVTEWTGTWEGKLALRNRDTGATTVVSVEMPIVSYNIDIADAGFADGRGDIVVEFCFPNILNVIGAPADYGYCSNCYFSRVASFKVTFVPVVQLDCVAGETKCEGTLYYACLDEEWLSHGEVVGQCGVTEPTECSQGETKCEGTILFSCEDGSWSNRGEVVGQCGVIVPEGDNFLIILLGLVGVAFIGVGVYTGTFKKIKKKWT